MGDQVIITASSSFTATHVCAEAEPHPHTWKVKAYFKVAPRTDARCYLAMVDAMCAGWDSKQLPRQIEWNEEIAAAIGTLVNCVGVEVERDAERIGAVWWSPEMFG